MTRREAEKLLGGHATGTLTEAERQSLLAAALAHQEVFDALMDEEALRELLADPIAKAQLLAALAPAPAPRVVPFWRRTGVLGAAASLLVAATAGLVYLRSPDKVPPPLEQEAGSVKQTRAAQALVQVQAKQAIPAPAAPSATSPAPVAEPAKARMPAPAQPRVAALAEAAPAASQEAASRSEYRRAEVQDQGAKKVESPRPRAAAVEVVAPERNDGQKLKADSRNAAPAAVPGAVPGGVVGGVVGGVLGGVASRVGPVAPRGEAAPLLVPAPASSARPVEGKAAAFAPAWTLEPRADGTTRVWVKGPLGTQAVLLRRRAARVDVLPLRLVDSDGPRSQWRTLVRLAVGDVLDLYLLDRAVADPARLPEAGPVDGSRVRIYPPGN